MKSKDRRRFRHLLGASAALGALLSAATANADATAAAAAAAGPACTSAQPFYWEIGGANGAPLASGQVGGNTYGRTTVVDIASASKWVFGAYVLQRFGGVPSDPTYAKALAMQTGYNNFKEVLCTSFQTVNRCFTILNNDAHDANADGVFYYAGGNSQYLAATPGLLNLGGDTSGPLLSDISAYLQLGPSMSYGAPALAGGMKSNAQDYAAFLQRLMPGAANGYVMKDYLTYQPVSTTPCPANEQNCSPMGTVAWHYTLNHWVEDNSVAGMTPDGTVIGPGDGAISSPGAYGFYPWLRQGPGGAWYYGIVSRKGAATGYQQSVPCGQAIRAAFFS
ncbi:hypothetical protein [Phenylobacterium sp.]|uniref:hypothetical protein n=1 Tax=Phenylobacterium sp. TaxID=1871053 RepID=UPI0035B2B1E8